jgi:AcrR family transcriptional regulator
MSGPRPPRPPDGFAAKRADLTDQLADIALSDGLSALTLRSAAERLGTSDRMLIYYFSTKAELVRAVLACISARQTQMLAAPRPARRQAPRALLLRAWSIVSDPRFMPFMRVWAEVASRGTRGEDEYRHLSREENARWLVWIEDNLDVTGDAARRTCAAAILTILEGATMLEMSSPGCTEGVAVLLGGAFERRD